MLGLLGDFAGELRRAGLPVSPDELVDAANAVVATGLAGRDELRAVLGCCLVKSEAHREAFLALFELYFPPALGRPASAPLFGDEALSDKAAGDEQAGSAAGREPSPEALLTRDELRAVVLGALAGGDLFELERAARLSVAVLAGIEAGRPVGPSYYLQRTLRGLDADGLLEHLLEAAGRQAQGDGEPDAAATATAAGGLGPAARLARLGELGELGRRLLVEEYRRRLGELRRLIDAEVRRRLAEERGAVELARVVRRPLVEDIEFMHASRAELAEMRRALGPLTRVLAARLARRRRHERRGPLDFRATIRRSLSSGGVPLELRFRAPHPAKPELVVLADVSGSVASFARFTLLLLAAMSGQFSKLRSFLFIDGVDEVTSRLRRGATSPAGLEAAVRDADVVASDGHSDYGRALESFAARHAADVGPRTTLIVLGDARNNYHASGVEILADLRHRARHLYWLNPEPRPYWNSGDSIIGVYAPPCEAVVECRNLRQLEAFVGDLA